MKNETKKTATKKTVTVNNATKTNEVVKIDFTEYLNHINDLTANGELVNSCKNNNQLSLAKYCGIMVNANSTDYKPNDSYVRFKNNTQFQLQYNSKLNTFIGFNIRLCTKSHIDKFTKWFKRFDKCNDNARIIKTEYVSFDSFSDVINELINLPKYDRDVEVITK